MAVIHVLIIAHSVVSLSFEWHVFVYVEPLNQSSVLILQVSQAHSADSWLYLHCEVAGPLLTLVRIEATPDENVYWSEHE